MRNAWVTWSLVVGFLGLISDLSHFPGVPILSKQTKNLEWLVKKCVCFRDCILKTEAETEPKTECCLGFSGSGLRIWRTDLSVCVLKYRSRGLRKRLFIQAKVLIVIRIRNLKKVN